MDKFKDLIDFIREQEDIPEEPKEETPEKAPTPVPGGMPGEFPSFEEEPQYTESYIGKMYEMKKIHARLLSLMSFLELTTNKSLIKLRAYVVEALELFRIVTSNLDTYKDKIGEIIVIFYKFLRLSYVIVQAFYEKENRKEVKGG
jgi:hypothetical protein